MKKKVFLSVALLALMAVGAFAQYTAESNFQVTKTATAVTISKFVGANPPSEVNIPPTIQNLPVTAIGANIFSTGMGNVTSLIIPASVTSIQATAFYVLANLRSVTFLGPIPSRGLADRAFDGDLAAKFYATDRNNGTPGTYTRNGATWTLTPATAQTSGTTADGIAWSRTADGNGIRIGRYTGTSKDVRIPDRINNLPVVEINNSAFERQAITSVVIPNTVTKIGNRAFFNAQFTSVTLPTSLVTIGEGAFQMCNNLASITIPNTVTTIGVSAFDECRRLTTVTLPVNIKTIEEEAFYNCAALTTITIPASVTRITFGPNVFQGATNVNAASKTALQRVGYTGTF